MKMRGTADQLAAIGKLLDDDELVMHIMAGFGPECETLVVNTIHQSDSPNLQDIQLAFQTYEVRIAQQHSSYLEHSANIAYCGRGSGFIGGYPSGAGRGTPQSGFARGNRANFGKVLLCRLRGRT